MGCIQEKISSPVVIYEPHMGEQFYGISGKEVQQTQIIMVGITSSGIERIFAFDILTMKFKALVIPSGMSIWNYSSIVQISNKEIIITGGLSGDASEISNQAFIYDITTCRAIRLPNMNYPRYTHISTFFKGKLYVIGGRDYGEDDNTAIRTQCERFNFQSHKWEKISQLNIPRCTGFSFIYKDEIYVCGGLTGRMHRSRVIERYDSSIDRWIELDFKLSKGLECGSILPASHFFSDAVYSKDKFIIIGGNTEQGSLDTVFVYSLTEKSVISASNMNRKRVLQKTIAHSKKIIVFGGSEHEGIEIYDQESNSWKEDFSQSYSAFASPLEMDLFASSLIPVVIKDFLPPVNRIEQNLFHSVAQNGTRTLIFSSDQSKHDSERAQVKNSKLNEEIEKQQVITEEIIKQDLIIEQAYLFGTDIDPFILEIDFLNQKIEKKQVPLVMRLFQHQGVIRIQSQSKQKHQFILLGGVHDGMIKTVSYTYLYQAENNSAKRLPNMIQAAFAFAIIVDKNYIYVIGGKSASEKFNQIQQQQPLNISSSFLKSPNILSTCQRFDYLTNQWSQLPSLNIKRVSAMAVVIFQKIFVFGGFKGDSEPVRPNEIEIYDPQAKHPTWYILKVKFMIGLEGAQILKISSQEQSLDSSNSIMIFGGRTSSGEIKSISKIIFEKTSKDKEESAEELSLSLTISYNKVNQMIQGRCLQKIVQPYRSQILIFGGSLDPNVECVDIQQNYESLEVSHFPHLNPLISKLSMAIKKTKDSTLKQYGFAY